MEMNRKRPKGEATLKDHQLLAQMLMELVVNFMREFLTIMYRISRYFKGTAYQIKLHDNNNVDDFQYIYTLYACE